jgi:hypothetical protein
VPITLINSGSCNSRISRLLISSRPRSSANHS